MKQPIERAAVALTLASAILGIGCGANREAPLEAKRSPACNESSSEPRRTNRPTLRYAKNLEIDYDDDGLAHIRVLQPWRGADRGLHYITVPCGRTLPAADEADAIFSVPITRAITTSSTRRALPCGCEPAWRRPPPFPDPG